MCLEQATIAEGQGASEDQKFFAKTTQLNMNLFLANGISVDKRKNLKEPLLIRFFEKESR